MLSDRLIAYYCIKNAGTQSSSYSFIQQIYFDVMHPNILEQYLAHSRHLYLISEWDNEYSHVLKDGSFTKCVHLLVMP